MEIPIDSRSCASFLRLFLPCHEIWRSIPSSKAFSMFPMCLVVVSPGLNRWTHHRWSKQGWLRFKRRKMWNSPWNSPYLKLCYRQSAMVNTMSTSMLVYPRVYHVISPCPKTVCPRESSLARKLCGKSAMGQRLASQQSQSKSHLTGQLRIMWVKQCHVYRPWLGMVNIPPIKMVMTGGWFMKLFYPH